MAAYCITLRPSMRGTQRLCSSRFLLQLCSCFSSVLAPALFLLQLCSSRFLLQPSRCPSLPPPFFAAALVGRQFVPSPSPLPRRPLASLLSLCPGVAADAWRSLALRCRLLSYSCWAGCGCECVFASAVQYILLHTRMQVSRLNCAFIFVKDAGGGVAEGGAGGDGERVGAREEGRNRDGGDLGQRDRADLGKRDRADLGLPSFQVPCAVLSMGISLSAVCVRAPGTRVLKSKRAGTLNQAHSRAHLGRILLLIVTYVSHLALAHTLLSGNTCYLKAV